MSFKVVKGWEGNIEKLRKRLAADKRTVNVGIPSSASEPDGTPSAVVAMVHEYGSPAQGIPERPFMHAGIVAGRETLQAVSINALRGILNGMQDVTTGLGQLGEAGKASIQKQITSGQYAPLKAATIERKGSSKPLVDTGAMRGAVAWEISND